MSKEKSVTRLVYLENDSSGYTHMSEKDGWAFLKSDTTGRKTFREYSWVDNSFSYQAVDTGKFLHIDYSTVGSDWLDYVTTDNDDCKFVTEDATNGRVYIRGRDQVTTYWNPTPSGGPDDVYVVISNIKGFWIIRDAD